MAPKSYFCIPLANVAIIVIGIRVLHTFNLKRSFTTLL